MASVNLSGTLTNPEGEPDEGAIVKFTLLTTTGNTVSSSKSQLDVPQDGLYDIDIVYGNLRVDYINEDGSTRFVAIVTVNGDTVATSLPELLNAVVPPTDAQLLQFQAILADAVTAKTGAELAETGALAAEAGAVAAEAGAEAAVAGAVADIVNIRRETVHNISILTDAVANTDIAVGDAINLAERTAGNGGGAMWDVVLASGVTANTFNIVACTGIPTLALVLRVDGEVNVKQFGAVGDGFTDNTEVIQSVIEYVKSNPVLSPLMGSAGGGLREISFPRGAYLITDRLEIQSVTGIKISGEGKRNTSIILDGEYKTLCYMSAYINVKWSDITFMTGTITDDNGRPDVDIKSEIDRTNVCFDFNGNGGGTFCTFEHCDFRGFNEVLKSTLSSVNADNHTYSRCGFYSNNTVWNNTNINAVIWYFDECQLFFNRTVFLDAGYNLFVNGGDSINPGEFYKTTGAASLGSKFYCTGVRFENYQNLDPTETPVYLSIATGSYQEIIFSNCSNVGGGDITGKTLYDIKGLFDITFESCDMRGDMSITPNVSSGGLLGRIRFDDCRTTPNITQSPVSNQGNKPASIIYNNSNIEGNSYSRSTRSFGGAIYNATDRLGISSSQQEVLTQFTLNASSAGIDVDVPSADKYYTVVMGAKIIHTRNGGADYTITLWQDSTKVNKIFEKAITNDVNSKRISNITESEMFQLRDIAKSSLPLYLEFSSTGSSGTITATTYLELGQR